MAEPFDLDDFGGGQHPTDVLVVTTNDVPGYRVDRVIGEVFGLTVRSRNLGSQLGAGLKSLAGGELRMASSSPRRSVGFQLPRRFGWRSRIEQAPSTKQQLDRRSAARWPASRC